jgi:HD-GYP domain-containing protein (c-di-GMP phosphodiesterase class II)
MTKYIVIGHREFSQNTSCNCTIASFPLSGVEVKLLRLPRSKVKIGAPLPWNVRDEETRLLLSRGHVIESEAQLDALLERGAWVDIEEARAAGHLHIAAESSPVVVPHSQSLFDVWGQSADEMRKLMAKVPHAPELLKRVDEFVAWLIELVDKDGDIALYHCVRQESAHAFFYGYNHSIHTAILCLLLARRLQWPPARMMSLVKAAITMNMAVLDLQGQMADQEDPMRESQKVILRRHPQEAADWLAQAGVSDADWLSAVALHHERPDGSGYPKGLTDVPDIAVALRVTDVFMSKISPRKLRPSLPIQEAAKQLFREDQGGSVSSAIIREFGLYPPGDLVKLASGEIGVVMRRTGQVKCPIVAAITDGAGHPTVRTAQRDTSQAAYAIVASVVDKSLVARMPPERVYGYASVSPKAAPP